MDITGKKIGAVLFIAAASAGIFLIIWFFRPKADDTSGQGEHVELTSVLEEETGDEPVPDDRQQKKIPAGMKAVSIPVNYFGDSSELLEGDRVDIISTYYRDEEGDLFSEKIIAAGEIIRLEKGEANIKNGADSGGFLTPDATFTTGTAIDMGSILVLTFFVTDDQALQAFTALERGMLYIAVCPRYPGDERDGS